MCFAFALRNARLYGGVIEHPAGSHAWEYFGLREPPASGGWVPADTFGGWTCQVEQGQYGHYARKPTWLVAYRTLLPPLAWGVSEAKLDPAVIARMGLERAKRLGEVGARGGGTNSKPRISTPIPFRDVLLYLASTVTFRD